MRKLASIQKITNIEPIPDYDRVELATVLGWSCIVKKDDFKVGDLVVYFEPDSQLYPHPIWDDFLYKRKYVIKTLKMCKTISQGLILPLDIIVKLNPKAKYKEIEDFDLTDILNVTHYEKKNQSKSNKKSNPIFNYLMKFKLFRKAFLFFKSKKKEAYPTHLVSKTDENNIQSVPNILKKNIGERFYISEKLEGQNGNYILEPGFRKNFIICSHNVRLSKKENSNWHTIAEQLNIEEILRNYYNKHKICVAIQGEIIGEGIQKNIYGIKGLDFYLFNVKDLTNNRYFTLIEKINFCLETGLKLVPILDTNFEITVELTPKKLLELANGKSYIADTPREGFVVRHIDNDLISFKVRSPEYLLHF